MAFGQVLATVGAMIPETEALFDAESLAAEHPELILEQARDVLMLRSLDALRELTKSSAVADIADPRATDLEEETRRDPLTGVYNRAHFERAVLREFANAATRLWPLSIARVELDDFKAINDRFGQQAGDRILQATARLIRGQTRETDLIARIGFEEFVVLMPATDSATARRLCDRIVETFKDAEHLVGSENARVAVSLGCATFGGGTAFASAGELLQAASPSSSSLRRT
jgi:diguanylate cyclase (GGDEF)-like protein